MGGKAREFPAKRERFSWLSGFSAEAANIGPRDIQIIDRDNGHGNAEKAVKAGGGGGGGASPGRIARSNESFLCSSVVTGLAGRTSSIKASIESAIMHSLVADGQNLPLMQEPD